MARTETDRFDVRAMARPSQDRRGTAHDVDAGAAVATGSSAEMRKLADKRAKLIDLGGRTVIPGLTDGHIHGIRAALTFATEVNWIGVPSLNAAL